LDEVTFHGPKRVPLLQTKNLKLDQGFRPVEWTFGLLRFWQINQNMSVFFKMSSSQLKRQTKLVKVPKFTISGLCCAVAAAASAQQNCTPALGEVFSAALAVQNASSASLACQNLSTSSSKVAEIISQIRTRVLDNATNYTGNEAMVMDLRFNGVPMSLTFATVGSSTLQYKAPELGIDQTFTGRNRNESLQKFQDWLFASGSYDRVLKSQAKNSPVHVTAGQNGVVPNMVNNEFSTLFYGGEGFTPQHASESGTATTGATTGAVTEAPYKGVGLSLGYANIGGHSSTTLTVPFSYTLRNSVDARQQIVINAPVTINQLDGARTYIGQVGVTWRLPQSDAWTIAPTIRMGIGNSKDLGAATAVVSGGITSVYRWEREGNVAIVLGNMAGFYKTVPIALNSPTMDSKLEQFVLRNGLMYSKPVTIDGKRLAMEVSVVDTRYMGTKIFTSNTQEVSLTFGNNRRGENSRTFWRGGVTAIVGPGVKGINLNIGYWF
jgi:hypothetical protein